MIRAHHDLKVPKQNLQKVVLSYRILLPELSVTIQLYLCIDVGS
jgi:hypothetical protein